MKPSNLAGTLQLVRPFVRRVTPARLHNTAGYLGRRIVKAVEAWHPPLSVPHPHVLPLRRSGQARRLIIEVNAALGAGGAERQLVNLLGGLAARRVPAMLLTLHLSERSELQFFVDRLSSSNIELQNARPSRQATERLVALAGNEAVQRLTSSLGWAPADVRADIIRLSAEFADRNPKVVHGWQDATGIVAAFAALATGVPKIVIGGRNVHPEHFSHGRPYMRPAYQYLATRPEVVLTNNSEAGARSYADWIGIDHTRIIVIRNGIDTARLSRPGLGRLPLGRKSFGLSEGVPLVGGAFRLQAEKRPMLWLEAAARIRRLVPNAQFVVFGEGTMRRRMLRAAVQLGIGDSLVLPGNVDDMHAALAMLDVFLLASAQEGTPNVVLETTNLGVPVVATDVGGTRESMLDGATGLLVADGPNSDALAQTMAEAVVRVLTGAIDRARLATIGPTFVAARFGLEQMVEDTLELYALNCCLAPEDNLFPNQ